MGWDNSYQTIIILPSGATMGARIVLDGEKGVELVYNTDGELIASIAPENGTDDQGNSYFQGITNYAGHEYVQLGFGNVLLGVTPDPDDPTFHPQAGLLGIDGDSGGIGLQSARNETLNDYVLIELRSGKSGAQSGTVDYRHMQVDADLWVARGGNAVVARAPAGQSQAVPVTWQTPSYNTGCAGATAIGGPISPVIPLRYRFGVEDTLIIEGTFTCTSSSAAAGVFQLDPDYKPKVSAFYPIPVLMRTSAGTVSTVWMDISGAGNLNITTTLGSSISVGATYSLARTEISLGTLP